MKLITMNGICGIKVKRRSATQYTIDPLFRGLKSTATLVSPLRGELFQWQPFSGIQVEDCAKGHPFSAALPYVTVAERRRDLSRGLQSTECIGADGLRRGATLENHTCRNRIVHKEFARSS
jgi:hypothetical protein